MFTRSPLKYIPMLCVMGIIFFLSHQSGDAIDLPDLPDIDKILHALVYGTLAGSVLYTVEDKALQKTPVRVLCLTVFFCVLYGVSDEYHQSFIQGRYPSGWDLLADGTGALVVSLAWLAVVHRHRAFALVGKKSTGTA